MSFKRLAVVVVWSVAAALLISSCTTPASPTPTAPATKPAPPPTAAPPAPTAATTSQPTVAAKPTAAPKTEPAKTLAPLSPPVAVKLGVIGSASDAGFYIGVEKGYFKEQGLDVSLEPVRGGTEVVPVLATGALDVAGGAVNPGLINATLRGIPIRVVADKGSLLPGFGFQSLVVRKDLIDSGKFKDFKDLKGAKVALNTLSSVDLMLLSKALEKGGLTLNDVEMIQLAFADHPSALGNKAVDAATLIEPFVTRTVEEKLAANFLTFDKLVPNQQISTVIYGPLFMQTKAEAARRFMVGYVKAVRDYNDAFTKNKGKADIIAILTKQTTIKDAALWQKITPPGLNPDGFISKSSLAQTQDFFIVRNLMQEKANIDQLVDNSYVEYALQQLGKYAP